jgi:hypothetical protein
MKYKTALVSVLGLACLTFAVVFNERNISYSWLLQDENFPQDSSSWNRKGTLQETAWPALSQLQFSESQVPTFELLTDSPASKVNPLTAWVEDPTVTQGTYIQKDNSKRLIYPWAYDSDAFDLRRDRPFDWFDDDDPREANNGRRFLVPSRP